MNTSSVSFLGIAILAIIAVLLLFITANLYVYADDDCCPPPRLQPAAARFQSNAQVTVYIDTTTGFTPDERTAITQGLQDWNDEPNNSGVHYNVVETDTPPPPGGNNTVICRYIDSFASGNGGSAITMSDSRSSTGVVTNVHPTLTFWKNIRSGAPSFLMGLLRSTARHEGAWTWARKF